MDGTAPAGPGGQPGGKVVPPPRLAVMMDKATDAGHVCRVDAPDRVLRIWALLNSADDELRRAGLPPGATARLRRQLDALTVELARSVSPALASELHHLVSWEEAAELTADELRMAYASLLGWTGGLVIGMLSQLELASTKAAQSRPGPQLVPGT
jgi:Protein of unknown function (DUF2587)